MDDEEFQQKLAAAFAVEAGEHLAVITSGLLELEKELPPEHRRELVETTFREAHSLKGAARAVNRRDIESICQALETVFASWKRQPAPVPRETFDALNRAVDLLARILPLPGGAASSADRTAIAHTVQQLGQPSAPSAVTPPTPPEAPPNGGARAVVPSPAAAIVPALHAETIRIPTAKMDALLRQTEELVGLKLALRNQASETRALVQTLGAWRGARMTANAAAQTEGNDNFIAAFEEKLRGLSQRTAERARAADGMIEALLKNAKQLVMLPVSTLLDLVPKQVRDLARESGKEVALALHGREIEIDKRILEELKDPLLHLLRNSLDHGIEKPDERTHNGKPAEAKLTIGFTQREANKVRLTISDDGGGIDANKVKAAAVKSGVISDEESARLGEPAAFGLIFQSGVSTSAMITELSGRGLGMAIVREKVERLGGSINIESTPGAGTTFTISLPVTLSTFAGIVVAAGGQRFVIPTAAVARIARFKPEAVGTVSGRETVSLEGRAIALARLDDVLELPRRRAGAPGDFLEALLLGSGREQIAFVVDEVLEELEVLVKELGPPLVRVRNVAAATILGSGAPVPILNIADLLKSAVCAAASGKHALPASAPTAPLPELLVVDDSVTSRMLLKNILESVGYRVATAPDGVEAIALLATRKFGLVVSDVEMPRMDGIELTTRIRADKTLADLPVVLVTALGSREHQERGADAGANAYIVKSSFEQSNLLEVVRKLI